MRYVVLSAVISLVLVAGTAAGQVPGAPDKRVTAIRTDERPELDGRLDEPLWQRAAVVDEFHEVSPNEFDSPSEETRFYVIYGRDALYIGAELTDSEPDRIVARVMRQGDFSEGEDARNRGRTAIFAQLRCDPGYVALDGDPLDDINAVRNVPLSIW